jgi:hypothetical protein
VSGTVNFEDGYEAAVRLAETVEQQLATINEAETRLRLIDTLLFDCLGWSRDDASVEDHHDGRYADYVLDESRPLLLVEAKRSGESFDLPADMPRVAKLTTLFAAASGLKPAVEQALGYALERGMAFAAVSNGRQIVAFLASRQDGVRPIDGRALAFASSQDVVQAFRVVWDNLSPSGCSARQLNATLGVTAPALPPAKLSSRLPGYPGYQPRSTTATELQILGELFLLDLIQDEGLEVEFLRECYCESGALSQYAEVSRGILQTRYSAALGETLEVRLEPARSRKGLSKTLGADVSAAAVSRRPIILLGDVGVGKTMFLRHLIRIDAKDLAEQALLLYIDLGEQPALAELREFVTRRFIEELRDEHGVDIFEAAFVRRVYRRELKDFANGIYGGLRTSRPGEYEAKEIEELGERIRQREGHLRRSLEELTTTRRQQVIIVLDNVDQRPPEFQEDAFLLAQTLASTWPGTVFVTLRPETFHRSRKEGTLTAYQPRVFTIPPPRIDRVLVKRIEYGRNQLRANGRLPTFPTNVTLDASTFEGYLDVLIQSFGRNEQLVRLIDNVSGGNVRRALEYVTTFVGSGHTKPEQALEIYESKGAYVLPAHEFLRAILLGDRRWYNPQEARIPNLLDISQADGREHFLATIVLALLLREGRPDIDEGWVRAERVHRFAQSLGFAPEQTRFALDRAVSGDLVEAIPFDGPAERYRITAIGAFLHQHLLHDFTYLDVVVVDTPILDAASRGQVDDARSIVPRLDRCEIFAGYLTEQFIPLVDTDCGVDWPARFVQLQRQIETLRARLQPRD